MNEKSFDDDIDEIPKVEIYESEVNKRKNSLSTWVLIAILLLGGYYLWNTDNLTGSSAVNVESAVQQEKVSQKKEVSVEKDEGLIVKEFVEGDLVSFPNLEAVDPEGQPISYTFTAPLNEKGEWKTKKGDAGEYLVKVTASDGVNTAVQNVLIIVKPNNANHPPVLTLDKKEYRVKEGEILKISASTTDEDNDNVTITYEGFMNSDTRKINFDEAGTHKVIVKASDGKITVKKEVTVIVEDVNRPPVFKQGAFD